MMELPTLVENKEIVHVVPAGVDPLYLRELIHNFRNSVIALQTELLKFPQVECNVKHHFIKGAYCREIFIPAGTLIIGKIHKDECLVIVSKGRALVASEFAQREIIAPCSFVAPALTKQIGYHSEDTIWTTVHVTDETDIAKLEAELAYPDYPEEVDACH
jgi:hypothetical protein